MDSWSRPAVTQGNWASPTGDRLLWEMPEQMQWDARSRKWHGSPPRGGIEMEISNEVVEDHLAKLMAAGQTRLEATHLVRSVVYWAEQKMF
jgi:hypothetical protein